MFSNEQRSRSKRRTSTLTLQAEREDVFVFGTSTDLIGHQSPKESKARAEQKRQRRRTNELVVSTVLGRC